VTIGLLVVNAIVFLFLQPAGYQWGGPPEDPASAWIRADAEEHAWRWGAVACELTTGTIMDDEPDGCEGELTEFLPESKSIPVSLLTAMFLHGDILHLAGNLLFLWVFGRLVEDRLGRANHLALYLLGGVAATLGFVALNPNLSEPLIGASGAIAATMGAYLALAPRSRVLTIISTAAFQVVYVPAVVVLVLYFVTQFVTQYYVDAAQVAWEAHAAGMLVGFLAGLVLRRVPAVARRAELEAADDDLRMGATF
jgi:membrane associated rhomboid family serine protease